MVLATVWTSSYWFVVIIVIVLVLWVQRALIIATVIPTRRRRILVVLSIIGVVLCLLARLLEVRHEDGVDLVRVHEGFDSLAVPVVEELAEADPGLAHRVGEGGRHGDVHDGRGGVDPGHVAQQAADR